MDGLGRVGLVAVVALGLSAKASAQRLTGAVRESGAGAPIAGAVVSILDSAGRIAARTITGVNGRYALVASSRVTTLRVVRIGFRPTTLPLTNRVPTDTSLDIAMERIPILLETVRISSAATCGDSPSARAALGLWEQARAELLATIVAREANPGQVTTLRYERRMNTYDRRITQQNVKFDKGVSRNPFVARAATALAADGYMQRVGLDDVYYAPDADVMFDESFADSHCFGVEVGVGDHKSQIGLTFVPRSSARRDNRVDVRGTLWMNSATPALVQLEYRYTGVDPVADGAGIGGTMHFQSMSNGVVFIDEWVISLPILKTTATRTLSRDTIFSSVLASLGESGGVVLEAKWPDGTQWTGKIGAIAGRVTERGSSTPIPGAALELTGVAFTVTEADGRFSFPLLTPGRYGLRVHDSTFGQFLRPRSEEREAIVTRGATVEVNFEVVPRASLADAVCKGQRRSDANTSLLLGRITDGTGAAPRTLRVESAWQAEYAISTTRPNVSVITGEQSNDVDAAGRFFVCGVARGRPIRLRALLGKRVVADTVVTATETSPSHLVDWNVRPGLFATAQLGDGSVFSGRVVRVGDGAPIADAELWITPGDIGTRTDSAGQFRLVGLASGPQILQVRRIGYALHRDTVTVRPREETVRQVVLTTQTALDTVRTTDGMVKYNSPRLREFEERRARGFGRFIPEAELRKYDMSSLSAILGGRLPGINFVAYRSGTLMASTRALGNRLADPPNPRSPRACWVNVYVDGIVFYGGPPQSAPDMARMPVLDYAGVEFYGGGAVIPAQYNSITNNDCGVLLLWTRDR